MSSTVCKRYAATIMASNKLILLVFACISVILTYVCWHYRPLIPILYNSRVFDTKFNRTFINQSLWMNVSHGQQNNLIIGAGMNLHIKSLYRFSKSARSSCHHCTIILILTHDGVHSDDFKLLAEIFNLQLLTYEDLAVVRTEKAFQTMVVHGRRWIIFNDYLRKQETLGKTFDNVFFSDVRDTVFQRNVFDYMDALGDGLYAFLEDAQVSIATQNINAHWVKTCYDEQTLQIIGNKSVSCSGTVLGTWKAIMAYLSIMTSELLSRSDACLTTAGNDQGIHNYIIHRVAPPGIKIHMIPHETGFVGTLGVTTWLKRNKFGLVLNMKKEIYAVVHQLDRSSQLNTQYDKEYHILPDDILNIK